MIKEVSEIRTKDSLCFRIYVTPKLKARLCPSLIGCSPRYRYRRLALLWKAAMLATIPPTLVCPTFPEEKKKKKKKKNHGNKEGCQYNREGLSVTGQFLVKC